MSGKREKAKGFQNKFWYGLLEEQRREKADQKLEWMDGYDQKAGESNRIRTGKFSKKWGRVYNIGYNFEKKNW